MAQFTLSNRSNGGRASALCTISGLALGLGLLLAPSSARADGQPITKIAFTGEVADGSANPFATGLDGVGFSSAVINNSGQISFASRVSGLFGINDRGVYLSHVLNGGGNQQIARSGSALPGSPDLNIFFGADAIPNIGDSGRIVFLGAVGGAGVTTTNDAAVFATQGVLLSNAPEMIGREDADAPSITNVRYGAANVLNPAYFVPVVNAGGTAGFRSALRGSPVTTLNDTALWSSAPGSGGALEVRESNPTTVINNVNFGTMLSNAINDSGRMAVRVNLAGSGVTTLNDEALFLVGGGAAPVLIAREGTTAAGPGLGAAVYSAGGNINRLGNPAINNEGRVAFRSALANGGVTSTTDSALFAGLPGALVKLRREGEATGLAASVVFDSFDGAEVSDPAINASGILSMLVKVRGGTTNTTSDTVIYTGATLNTPVAREGSPVPNLAGVNFGIFNGGAPIAPAINDDGSLLFTSQLTGQGVTADNDGAIFGWTPWGGICLLVREGDMIDSDGLGTMRTIASLDVVLGSGGQDGEQRSLDDFGRVVFTAKFTDGKSGVYVTAVPAPSAGLGVALGALLAARRRRRPGTRPC